MQGVEIREVQDDDTDGLAALGAGSADGGRVGIRPRRKVSLLESMAARDAEAVGFVAVSAEAQIVGAAWLSYSRAYANNDSPEKGRGSPGYLSLSYLHSLEVDPAWRRQGIARALTDARLAHAATRAHPCVAAAAIQAGNQASIANARRWATRSIGKIRVTLIPPPRRPPRSRPDVHVRAIEPVDFDQVVRGLQARGRTHVLARFLDQAGLARLLAQRVGGDLLNEYVVAVVDGRIVAGLCIEDETRLSLLEVTRLPRALAAANLLLRVVPRDRLMRNLNIRLPWVEPGHELAARYLFQSARWGWRDRGSGVVVELDPTSPLTQTFRVPRWLPSTTLEIVVREPDGIRLPTGPLGLTP